MLASGPLITDPRNRLAHVLRHVEGIVADSGNATSLRIRMPSVSIDLSRSKVSV
jgi:hypothetical protein